jgi:hypothetical protein
VDHLSNKGILNVLLDRSLSGQPAGIPSGWSLVALFTNFVRLTDKALREYDAARAEVVLYLEPTEGMRTSPYIRAVDHMENCVSATHRAVLNAIALQAQGVGKKAPRLTPRQHARLRDVRHAIEHSDERIVGPQSRRQCSPFKRGESFSLRLANTSMVIGQHVLRYADLVSAMSKMHKTVEVIRGVETGIPGPNFPNAKLRTDPGSTGPGTLHPSEYFMQLQRLIVTH